MSQADILLANDETEVVEYAYHHPTINPFKEEHFVIGQDRIITVPESLRKIAVQYDHDSETVTFDCPKYWDDEDMSGKYIHIKYTRADGTPGAYQCSPGKDGGVLTVTDEDDPTMMHFNWTITRNVTMVDGNVSFYVCITDGEIDDETLNADETFRWSTETNEELRISKSFTTDDMYEEDFNADVVVQIQERIEYFEDTIDGATEKAEKLLGDAKEAVDEFETIKETVETAASNAANSASKAEKALESVENAYVKKVESTDNLSRLYGIRAKNEVPSSGDNAGNTQEVVIIKGGFNGNETYRTIVRREAVTENATHPGTFEIAHPQMNDKNDDGSINKQYSDKHPMTVGVAEGRYAKTTDIPSLDGYAKTTDIPSLDGYAKTTDIPSLDGYAKTTDIPSLDGYAKTTDIPSFNSLRGNNTGFSYLYIYGNSSPDNYVEEGHYFIINGYGYLPGGHHHGFLDIDYFNGDGFAPNASGAETVLKQTFRPWNTDDIYVRTYKHRENTWTDWKCITKKTKYMVYVSLQLETNTIAHLSFISDTQLTTWTYESFKAAFVAAFNGSIRCYVPIKGGGPTYIFDTAYLDTLGNLYFRIIDPKVTVVSTLLQNDVQGYDITNTATCTYEYNEMNVDRLPNTPQITSLKNVPLFVDD